MAITKHLTMARTLGVVIFAALSLGACATRDDIAQINSRLDSIDARVQSAAQSAESANQNAQRANQRLDQMEGRIQQLESRPARQARG
jgi:murein lipoprotein